MIGRLADILAIEPRGLNRIKSACYIGIGDGLYDQMVTDGRVSKPKHINARLVWDRRKLDEAFDALPENAESLLERPWEDLL